MKYILICSLIYNIFFLLTLTKKTEELYGYKCDTKCEQLYLNYKTKTFEYLGGMAMSGPYCFYGKFNKIGDTLIFNTFNQYKDQEFYTEKDTLLNGNIQISLKIDSLKYKYEKIWIEKNGVYNYSLQHIDSIQIENQTNKICRIYLMGLKNGITDSLFITSLFIKNTKWVIKSLKPNTFRNQHFLLNEKMVIKGNNIYYKNYTSKKGINKLPKIPLKYKRIKREDLIESLQ